MKTVEGTLTLLGNATISGRMARYSVIEISDTTLQGISVPTSLDNYVTRALNQQGTTKLFLKGKLLVGVGTPEGKMYCIKGKQIGPLILCALGVPLVPFLGVGLFFIGMGIHEYRIGAASSKLQAQGATAISY